MLQHIDQLGDNWAEEIQVILEKSCLGYPTASTIARINEGGSRVAGSKCPEVILSRRVSAFDRCFKDMRNSWKKIVVKRYVTREELTRKEYYLLDVVHGFVEGRITA